MRSRAVDRQHQGLLRRIAGICSSSLFFKKGRELWEKNSKNWNYPLSKWDKLWCGGYIILNDFAAGIFPPRFEDQAQAYQNEIEYPASVPGVDVVDVQKGHATKPFWGAAGTAKYLGDFNRLFAILQRYGVNPGQRLLELGCGTGWMAEFFAVAGYSVVGTTISHWDLELAEKKARAHECKELSSTLEFRDCAMESVDEISEFRGAFDAAFVYEALHHAFDWRKTLHAVAATLKNNGWLLLGSEPNRLHTCISYRVAKLSRTHEIGFSKNDLVRELNAAGFGKVEVLRPRFDNWITHFWIVARKANLEITKPGRIERRTLRPVYRVSPVKD
jgi:2-polyprenyl-3-methyl-5-hydroxy-6-metoxy-1,4-benzoquinol methylase